MREEASEAHTRVAETEAANAKLRSVMEEMLEKVAARNAELSERQHELEEARAELDKKAVQIEQLKKLVDHLRDASASSEASSSSVKKKNPPLEWAMSYEEVHGQLDRERERNRQLIDELRQARNKATADAAAAPLEEEDVHDLARRRPVAETAHEIPHRFHRQTNMQRRLSCPVCLGTLPLCRAVSACRFCPRVVHVGCEEGAPKDCGLSSDLALVLRSNAGNSEGVIQKGYLKVNAYCLVRFRVF